MKKLISITLAVIMLLSCAVIAVNASSTAVVSVRIEGSEKTLLDTKTNIEISDNNGNLPTVADVLKIVDSKNDSISIEGIDNNYITAVNDEKSGKFGGYDGWYYAVDDAPAEVGIGDYTINKDTKIVLYYGDFPCQYPVMDYSEWKDGIFAVKSFDATYDEEWNAVYSWTPVTGATLTLNGDEFTTDENGKIRFNLSDYSEFISVQISKKSQSGAPAVCRFGADEGIPVYSPVPDDPTQPTQPASEDKTTKISVPSDKTLYVGATYKIKASIDNPSGNTSYISDRKSVATVSKTGKITAVKKGTAVITVKNNKVSKTFKVTVKNPKLNSKKVSLKKKDTFKIKITGKVGKQTYKSSNKAVAKVSKTGMITAKKHGKATITVKTNNGVKLTIKVTVK